MARARVSRQTAAVAGRGRRRLSASDIRDLIALMRQSDIHEITIEVSPENRLTLRKPQPVSVEASAHMHLHETGAQERGSADAQHTKSPPADSAVAVTTQFVGIYRRAVKHGAKPFVAVGDTVEEGQIVAAVEALNLVNEVEAPINGSVVELPLKDGQAVEYGQTLVLIKP
jgi:acetyl-CoA carboxylase biotin carboxyl carrier protein